MKNNGHCPRCNRKFTKKSLLFKHVVQCEVQRLIPLKIVLTPIDSIMTNINSSVNTNASTSDMNLEPIVALPKLQLPISSKKTNEKKAEKEKRAEKKADKKATEKEPDPSSDKKADRKSKTKASVVQLVKSEPETILDTDGNAITPTVSSTQLDVASTIMEIAVEPTPDADDDEAPTSPAHYSDAGGYSPAGDDDSSDSESDSPPRTDALPTATLPSAALPKDALPSDVSITVVKQEPLEDSDDVIIIEDEPEVPILIPVESSPVKRKDVESSPVKRKDKKSVEKPRKEKSSSAAVLANALDGVIIKTEPIDVIETDTVSCELIDAIPSTSNVSSLVDPTIKIKLEPTDQTTNSSPAAIGQNAPITTASVSQTKRKEKKSKHKHKKDKRAPAEKSQPSTVPVPLLPIKQEPMDTGYEPTVASPENDTDNDESAAEDVDNEVGTDASTVAPNIAIKTEPNRPGYDDFDPVLAQNIKKEKFDFSATSPAGQVAPSLRLKISKTHGTLNATIIPHGKDKTPQKGQKSAKKTTVTSRIPIAPTAMHTETEAHSATVLSTPSTSSSIESNKDDDAAVQKKKSKIKKQALLMQKIREEMMARMAKEKEKATSSSAAAATSVPAQTKPTSPSKDVDTVNGTETNRSRPLAKSAAAATVPVISEVTAGDKTQLPVSGTLSTVYDSEVQIKTEKQDDGYKRVEDYVTDSSQDEPASSVDNNKILSAEDNLTDVSQTDEEIVQNAPPAEQDAVETPSLKQMLAEKEDKSTESTEGEQQTDVVQQSEEESIESMATEHVPHTNIVKSEHIIEEDANEEAEPAEDMPQTDGQKHDDETENTNFDNELLTLQSCNEATTDDVPATEQVMLSLMISEIYCLF